MVDFLGEKIFSEATFYHYSPSTWLDLNLIATVRDAVLDTANTDLKSREPGRRGIADGKEMRRQKTDRMRNPIRHYVDDKLN